MGCKMLLSTNDKTIKLWKIYGKKIKILSNMNMEHNNGATVSSGTSAQSWGAGKGLRLPLMATRERVVTATPKRTYSNAHAYHINSVALNSDGESFMSCDDLRLNVWNLNYSSSCFNIVDVKPANMEALSKVITSADFHPTDCHTFLYSSSRGCVRLGDMRAAALCDHSMKVFEEPEDPANKSFFSEIISSISNARFSRDGRHIVTRDYLNVRRPLFACQQRAPGCIRTVLATVLPHGFFP
jgi:serine/threonine-protein phosphatase 2A regulatory subunit B